MDSVLNVAFSSDGLLLASASTDGLVGLWDTHTEILQATLGHESPVLSVAFSPDSDLLATGSADGTARLWDPHIPQHKATLGHESPVESVAFDGNMLVTGSQDGRVRQWEITSETAPTSSSQEEDNEAPGDSESQPEGVTASTAASLTESTLDESVVTLTLNGRTYERSSFRIRDAITVSGISGVTVGTFGVRRVSDTEVTIELEFNGNFQTDSRLIFTVGAGAIVGYSGSALTAEVPVTAGLEADANNDGVVSIDDLVLVASNYGATGQNAADVNGDGVVDIDDLTTVTSALDSAAAAPLAQSQVLEMFTAADVKLWLTHAQGLDLTDATTLRGILFLEQLLAALIPKETTLLPNYPNPFNPETWIPYRLAEDAFVTLTIYNGSGRVVRTLNVGHRVAAFYESRAKAIYWDGRNEFGESVASGVYFYHLSAGDFSATRKMLIIK